MYELFIRDTKSWELITFLTVVVFWQCQASASKPHYLQHRNYPSKLRS